MTRSKSQERIFRTKSIQIFNQKKFLESINSSYLSIYLFIVICYFLIGIFFFYYFEKNWTIFDSFYFIIITFLTIGYGDFVPTNNTTKLYLCFHLFVGFTIIETGVKYILAYFSKQNELKLRTQIQNETNMINNSLQNSTLVSNNNNNNKMNTNENQLSFLQSILMKIYPFKPYTLVIIEDILIAFLIISLNIINGIIVHSYLLQKLTLVNSIYFSITTITTIGYGDIRPETFSSRLYIICYGLIGVLSTAKAIFLLNNARIKYIESKLYFNELNVEKNTHDFYNKNEFVIYKLIKMKLITVEIKEQIEELFNVMDITKSGMLSYHDIAKFQDLLNVNQNYIDDRIGLNRESFQSNNHREGNEWNDDDNNNDNNSNNNNKIFEKNLDVHLLSS